MLRSWMAIEGPLPSMFSTIYLKRQWDEFLQVCRKKKENNRNLEVIVSLLQCFSHSVNLKKNGGLYWITEIFV